MNHKAKGKEGEMLAYLHYQQIGCEILEANYRYKRSEIDLIALQNESLLIFVEVKSRSRSDYGTAEIFVSDRQRSLIKEAAESYIYGINWKKPIRFDIVCVNAGNHLEVFEDAF